MRWIESNSGLIVSGSCARCQPEQVSPARSRGRERERERRRRERPTHLELPPRDARDERLGVPRDLGVGEEEPDPAPLLRLDDVEPALAPLDGAPERDGPAERRDRVVDARRRAVDHLFGEERVRVDEVGVRAVDRRRRGRRGERQDAVRVQERARECDRVRRAAAEPGRDGQARAHREALRGPRRCAAAPGGREVHVQVQERLRSLDRLELVLVHKLVGEEREELGRRREVGLGPRLEHGRGREGRVDEVPGEGRQVPRLRVAEVGQGERELAV